MISFSDEEYIRVFEKINEASEPIKNLLLKISLSINIANLLKFTVEYLISIILERDVIFFSIRPEIILEFYYK